MKKILTIAALAAASVLMQQTAHAGLLLAPGFEASQGAPDATTAPGNDQTNGNNGTIPGNPWNGFGNSSSPFTGFYTSKITAHSGTQVGKALGLNGNVGGLYQTAAGVAGTTYTATAWFFNHSGSDALTIGTATSNPKVTLNLIFKTAANGTGTTLLSVASPTSFDPSSPTDTWVQATVTAVAPAGTLGVQLQGFLSHPAGSHGVMYMDDADITTPAISPEPASLVALSAAGALVARRRRR